MSGRKGAGAKIGGKGEKEGENGGKKERMATATEVIGRLK